MGEVIPGAAKRNESPILEENPEDIFTSSEDSEEKSSELLLIEDNNQSERKISEQEEEKIPENLPQIEDISEEITEISEIEIPSEVPVEEIPEIQKEISEVEKEI